MMFLDLEAAIQSRLLDLLTTVWALG